MCCECYSVAVADSGVSDVLDEQAPATITAAVTPLRQRETSSRHQRVLPASSSSSSSQTVASLSSVINARHRDDVTDHVTVKEGT